MSRGVEVSRGRLAIGSPEEDCLRADNTLVWRCLGVTGIEFLLMAVGSEGTATLGNHHWHRQ